MAQVSLACRSLGYPSCEWALDAPNPEEAIRRFAEHAKCAHGIPEMGADLRHRVEGALRPH